MAFVKLGSMPKQPSVKVNTISSLAGGLNIHDIPWQIREDQSPEMKNMWWDDGALRSRPAQITLNNGIIRSLTDSGSASNESTAYKKLYNGWYVFQCNGRFYGVTEDLQSGIILRKTENESEEFVADKPGGTFFLHNNILYYKAKGAYVAIRKSNTLDTNTGLYTLTAGAVEAYIPTILMNADPNTKGAGDLYQPVNRLTNRRRALYNCDPDTTSLILPEYSAAPNVTVEYMSSAGKWVEITASATPSITKNRVTVSFSAISSLDKDGTNNVRVTYSVVENEAQYETLMDCNIAEVYGGGSGLCVVLAGCDAQPNAYFWSSNTDVSMDPGYFPVENYNLAENAGDPITAFGKQQNMLVIFQKNSTGRCVFSTKEVDGRTFITMDYTGINPSIGCDLPHTVQLIENNLVFANKRNGVMMIKDTSYAYENNIVGISRNVEKPVDQAGLIYDINAAPESVRSFDDGGCYWLCANGHAWLWNYSLGGSVSDTSRMSWFYFDGIQNPRCWFGQEAHRVCFLGVDGYFREFKKGGEDTYYDDGTWKTRCEDFEKTVTLPIQSFGTYEVLKNVEKTIFVVQGTGDAVIDIEYETDYEVRADLTPIVTRGWSLVPRNLSFRSLVVFPFAVTAVRKPGCRHVRHFLARLKNSARGEDFTFVSAQIYYTYQGVDR